jgi:hypothetical protein
LAVNKVTWQQVGHVAEPGRYMFRFGWLTIAADDLAVWEQFPNAMFALVKTATATDDAASTDTDDATSTDDVEEFHLGAFELPEKSTLSEK